MLQSDESGNTRAINKDEILLGHVVLANQYLIGHFLILVGHNFHAVVLFSGEIQKKNIITKFIS